MIKLEVMRKCGRLSQHTRDAVAPAKKKRQAEAFPSRVVTLPFSAQFFGDIVFTLQSKKNNVIVLFAETTHSSLLKKFVYKLKLV